MTNARLGRQLFVQCPNEVGTLAKVCQVFAGRGINIHSMCAYEQQNKGYFWLITDNLSQGADELRKMGYTVQEQDVMLVDLENRPGSLAPVAKVLGDAQINIHTCYFTSPGTGGNVTCCFHTANNKKALDTLQHWTPAGAYAPGAVQRPQPGAGQSSGQKPQPGIQPKQTTKKVA